MTEIDRNTDERRALGEHPSEVEVLRADLATAERHRGRALACALREIRLVARYGAEIEDIQSRLTQMSLAEPIDHSIPSHVHSENYMRRQTGLTEAEIESGYTTSTEERA